MPTHGVWTTETLFAAYEEYQRCARGLKPRTVLLYWHFIRLLLLHVFGEDPIDIARLTAKAVRDFVISVHGRFGAGTMKQVTTSVRSFCRFLRAHGLCDASLEAAVPTTACRRLSSLPRGLSDEQYRRLLTSFRTDLPCGYRDRAIVLCLSSLGMRPGELAGLALEDIDWHAGTLRLSSRKTGRGSVLPLPERVGTAIVEYLRHERPETIERRVFVRHDGPCQGRPITRGIVTGAVVRALRRAGIEAPIRGAYVLRHTVACRMVRRGTSLKEIADLLGHRSLDTTAVYAKVDIPALRDVALPWPEVTQ